MLAVFVKIWVSFFAVETLQRHPETANVTAMIPKGMEIFNARQNYECWSWSWSILHGADTNPSSFSRVIVQIEIQLQITRRKLAKSTSIKLWTVLGNANKTFKITLEKAARQINLTFYDKFLEFRWESYARKLWTVKQVFKKNRASLHFKQFTFFHHAISVFSIGLYENSFK